MNKLLIKYYKLSVSKEQATPWDRYELVGDCLGAPSFVFRSSNSMGLHLYYFLDQAVALHDFRNPSKLITGILERLLAASGA